jgi:hypothetical protein
MKYTIAEAIITAPIPCTELMITSFQDFLSHTAAFAKIGKLKPSQIIRRVFRNSLYEAEINCGKRYATTLATTTLRRKFIIKGFLIPTFFASASPAGLKSISFAHVLPNNTVNQSAPKINIATAATSIDVIKLY